MPTASANPTSQASATTLVTGRADYGIEVDWIYLSFNAQLFLELEGVANATVWGQYVAANGGSVVIVPKVPGSKTEPLVTLPASTDLDFSMSAAGSGFIVVGYREVPTSS